MELPLWLAFCGEKSVFLHLNLTVFVQKINSTLREKDGVSQPPTTNKASVQHIKKHRSKQPSVREFIDGILAGNISLLSRAHYSCGEY